MTDKIDDNALLERMNRDWPKRPVFKDKLQEREWSKFRLAQAYRIFSNHGLDQGMSGHITVKDPIHPHAFWVNPFGLHFKLIQPEDLLLVDDKGTILEESGPRRLLNVAAFMIHAKLHAARPDVVCAAHSHSSYGRAFSSLGCELDMISQDACAFYDDHAIYTENRGIAFESSEGEAIAQALGNKKAAILQNHGLLVVSDSIEGAVNYYIQLERACQFQMLADSTAAARGTTTIKISPQQAEATGKILGNPSTGWFGGLIEFELLEHQEGKKFDFGTE